METFKTTRDITEWLRKAHRHLSRFYAQRRKVADQERVRLLLDYLSRHEKTLEKALADLEDEAGQHIMDTYFQYLPEEFDELRFDDRQLQESDMTVDDVIRIVIRNDEALTRFYDRLAQTAAIPSVKDMFVRLKDQLEEERTRFVENAMHLKDI
jgi:rubrerythrin